MNGSLKELYDTSLAIDVLMQLGNKEPTEQQIELIESLLVKTTVVRDVLFNPKLTHREITCLYLAAMGKTSIQTGQLLNIQPGRVEQHRKEIKKNSIANPWQKLFLKESSLVT